MKRSTALKPLIITVIGLLFIACFVFWILSVMLPVTLVELRYQYKHVLATTLGVTDLRGLIIPSFRIDLKVATSVYTTNGITIPSLYIDAPVIYNVDPNNSAVYREALKHGIAHASGTAFPDSGKMGYYFAHSSTPTLAKQFNAVFYLLHKLEVQDEVYIFHEGKRYDYEVYAKQIVDPKDTAFLRYTNPIETIVLQTCWPPGTTAQRLLVFAKRVQHE